MVFSSLLFIFIYLVVTLALYYAVPNRVYRNVILCVLSLIFYGWGEPVYVFLMLASVAVDYFLALLPLCLTLRCWAYSNTRALLLTR